ncbi:MAG: winged helix-turn-helix domain-containing protein [Pirellulales bacterium]
MLCEHLWKSDWEGATNVIEVHVNRLRNKLEKVTPQPMIDTVRGRGYAVRAIKAASYYLRVRLAVWYGGVFAGLVLVALAVVYEGSRYTITQETDERLLEDAKETAQAVAQLFSDRRRVEEMLARKADTHTHERLFLQLLEPDGKLSWASKDAPPIVPEQHQHDEEGVFPVREVGVFRVAQRYVTSPGVPRYLVRVGASQEQINAAVWKQLRVMAVAGGAGHHPCAARRLLGGRQRDSAADDDSHHHGAAAPDATRRPPADSRYARRTGSAFHHDQSLLGSDRRVSAKQTRVRRERGARATFAARGHS